MFYLRGANPGHRVRKGKQGREELMVIQSDSRWVLLHDTAGVSNGYLGNLPIGETVPCSSRGKGGKKVLDPPEFLPSPIN